MGADQRGLFPNALELECSDGKKFFFCSFISRESAYKCVLALWKNVSPHASAFESDLEDEEEDDEEPTKEPDNARTTFYQKPEEESKGVDAPILPPEEFKGEEQASESRIEPVVDPVPLRRFSKSHTTNISTSVDESERKDAEE